MSRIQLLSKLLSDPKYRFLWSYLRRGRNLRRVSAKAAKTANGRRKILAIMFDLHTKTHGSGDKCVWSTELQDELLRLLVDVLGDVPDCRVLWQVRALAAAGLLLAGMCAVLPGCVLCGLGLLLGAASCATRSRLTAASRHCLARCTPARLLL